MRIEISNKGVGGRDEDWWYLVFDEETGNFFIEHEWAHMSFNFQHDNGSKTIPLAQAKVEDEGHYKMAVKVIKEKLFSR